MKLIKSIHESWYTLFKSLLRTEQHIINKTNGQNIIDNVTFKGR
mgnify:CR=1 FL=1